MEVKPCFVRKLMIIALPNGVCRIYCNMTVWDKRNINYLSLGYNHAKFVCYILHNQLLIYYTIFHTFYFTYEIRSKFYFLIHINPLTAEFFILFRRHSDNFLQTFTRHRFFSLVLIFLGLRSSAPTYSTG